MTDYGHQRIEFYGSAESVRIIFMQAKYRGIKVRLVHETGGPVSALVDDNSLSGGWH